MKLKRIVEENDTVQGRVFDLIIQVLIIFSLVCFSIETLPDLLPKTQEFLRISEIVVVIVFTMEYLLRLIFADRKLRFVFSFYGIIDLFAILPFYIASGIDLRSIRIFRLLRLVNAFKLLRFSKAVRRLSQAFLMVKEELALFFVLTCLLLFVSAVGIYYFENPVQPETFKSIFHSLWWAVESFTTVGYGDIYPVTVGGKIFTFIMLMIGLGIVAVPTGLFASALSKCLQEEK